MRCRGDRRFFNLQGFAQPIGTPDLLDGRMCALADGDEIKQVAHQAFGNVFRAFDHAPDLQVDACANLFCINLLRQRAFGERRQQRRGDPPEGACGGAFLHGVDIFDGIQHIGDAVPLLRGA